MNEIRTRFAPSPTGFLHIGGLRTALYSYAFAKSQGGKFILRIEDTDKKRFVPGSVEKIYEVLKKFGLEWDEGPFVQSERTKEGIYQQYAEKLISNGNAYYCFCPPKEKDEIEEEHEQKKIEMRDSCRNMSLEEAKKRVASGEEPAIRLKVPDNEKISFFDFVLKKEISWESKFVDEVMLLKSDGFPTYHLAAPVDDALMKISHIIRGRDWLPSTSVHILLFKYLGFDLPQIGHLTDILDPAGGKLSKRKGTVACEEFLADGYLPEAILNFIMLVGWAPKDNREIFSLGEFVDNFQKGSLQTANPGFNRKKLDWFNGEYIRKTQNEKLKTLIFEFFGKKYAEDLIEKTLPLVKDRINKLSDYKTLAGFLFEKPKVDVSLFGNLAYREHLKSATEALSQIDSWTNENIQKKLTDLIEEKGWKTGDFFMSFRIALSGSKFTPPITDCAEILGKEETLLRLSLFC